MPTMLGMVNPIMQRQVWPVRLTRNLAGQRLVTQGKPWEHIPHEDECEDANDSDRNIEQLGVQVL